jgi:hypothetical protein
LKELLLKEMPKVTKCLKCLKLRYPIGFIKRKKKSVLLYSLADFWFFMLKVPGDIKKDGAKRHHNFSHFKFQFILAHFSGLSGLEYSRFIG